ncbi:unnamed protein product [Linum trigynum]|uniref:RNase H type-1 domain-containing protein n=1 Tax=Linum trigynum TaxID=586398 RepID=A0AAV2CHC1_9ROSI
MRLQFATPCPAACLAGPAPSPFRCFIDGAVCAESHGAAGMVIVDSAGSIIFALGFRYEGMVDPYLVELPAFRDAIRWCAMHDIQGIEYLGDAQVVVNQIHRGNMMDARGGAILQEINGWKHQMFDFRLWTRSVL